MYPDLVGSRGVFRSKLLLITSAVFRVISIAMIVNKDLLTSKEGGAA